MNSSRRIPLGIERRGRVSDTGSCYGLQQSGIKQDEPDVSQIVPETVDARDVERSGATDSSK